MTNNSEVTQRPSADLQNYTKTIKIVFCIYISTLKEIGIYILQTLLFNLKHVKLM